MHMVKTSHFFIHFYEYVISVLMYSGPDQGCDLLDILVCSSEAKKKNLNVILHNNQSIRQNEE